MTPRVYPATVTEVHDGDSVRVFASLGFDTFRNVAVRLFGLNAIELSQPGGKEARDHLAGLIPAGTVVTLVSMRNDKYGGRAEGQIVLSDNRNVGDVMIADGYAARWNGAGPRPVPPWPIPVAGAM